MKASCIIFSLMLASVPGIVPDHAYAAYPKPVDMYINDFAAVISRDYYDIIRRNLSSFHLEKDIHIVLLTAPVLEQEFQNIEAYAETLFQRWQVGGKYHKGAVLILLAVKDRQVRIELGRGYGHRYDRKMQEIIDTTMLPYFKEAEYAAGLHAGTLAVMDSVKWFWVKFYAPLVIGGFLLIGAFLVIFPWGRDDYAWSPGGDYSGGCSGSSGSGGGFFAGGSGGASGGW